MLRFGKRLPVIVILAKPYTWAWLQQTRLAYFHPPGPQYPQDPKTMYLMYPLL